MADKHDTWKALTEPVNKGQFNCKHAHTKRCTDYLSRGLCNCVGGILDGTNPYAPNPHGHPWVKMWEYNEKN